MKLRLQFSLKWFLLGSALIAVLAGTIGKRLFDLWLSQKELAAQEKARLRLVELGVQIRPPNNNNVINIQFPFQKCASRDFQLLRRLAPFESIDLTLTGFADPDLSALESCDQLKTLRLGGNPGFTDEGVECLAKFAELKDLDLSKTGVTDKSLQHVSELENLERLSLVFTNVSSNGLSGLGRNKNLQFLDLSHTLIDDEAFRPISELRSLEGLRLDNTKVHGHGISTLARLPRLRTLDMRQCDLANGSGIENLQQVDSLYLDGATISPGFLRHVAKMRGLRTLSLIDSPITDEHFAELSEATQLTRLTYRGTLVTDQGLMHLENLQQMEFLGLRMTKVTADGAEALAAKLSNTLIMTDHGDFNREKFRWKKPTKRGEVPEFGRRTP